MFFKVGMPGYSDICVSNHNVTAISGLLVFFFFPIK